MVGIRPCIAASTGATSTNVPARAAERRDGSGTPRSHLRGRRDAFVGKRFPGREQRHPVGAEERLEIGSQLVGLARTGGNREHGRIEGPGHGGDHEVLARLGPGDDRPGSIQQQTLERLGAHQHIERLAETHRHPTLSPGAGRGRTPRTGRAAARQGQGRESIRTSASGPTTVYTMWRRPVAGPCTSARAVAPSCAIASGVRTDSHRPNSSSGIGREM